jgi:preprotein translocase subunit SecA
VDEVIERSGGDRTGLSAEFLAEELKADAAQAYAEREERLGSETMRELERRVILSVLDRKWREHLYEMDYLQEGIGLRAMAQRDPLVEYQREGYELFTAMMEAIKEESVGFLFNVEVTVEEAPEEGAEAGGGDIGRVAVTEAGGVGAAAPVLPTDELAAAESTPTKLVAKGLRNDATRKLEYSAPSTDGDGQVTHRVEKEPANVVVDPNASRAERRRQQREARKNR